MDCELNAKTNGEDENDRRHGAELDPKQTEGSKELGHEASKDNCDDDTRPGDIKSTVMTTVTAMRLAAKARRR